MDTKCWTDLPSSFTRDSLPSIPEKNAEFGLIIGVNCAKALGPLGFIPSSKTESKTALGWCIVSPIESSKINKREINCNLMTVQQAPNLALAKNCFAAQVRVQDVGIVNLLKKLYEADFTETNTKSYITVVIRFALKIN